MSDTSGFTSSDCLVSSSLSSSPGGLKIVGGVEVVWPPSAGSTAGNILTRNISVLFQEIYEKDSVNLQVTITDL